jgi:N-carbamoylputrescine amidase
MTTYKVALLHLAPELGAIEANKKQVERAVHLAAAAGADIAVTPETVIPGYHFAELIGTDWIEPQPDAWLRRMAEMAGQLKLNIFLGYQERDPADGRLYNAVFCLDKSGRLAGRHRKMGISAGHTAEAWAAAGTQVDIIQCDGFKAGILICADTWGPDHAAKLKTRGAQFIISPAAWPPRPCPPEGCWEKRSAETGLPVWVCNRTGVEPGLDFTGGESIVAVGGNRVLEYDAPEPAVLLFDWDDQARQPQQTAFEIIPLN